LQSSDTKVNPRQEGRPLPDKPDNLTEAATPVVDGGCQTDGAEAIRCEVAEATQPLRRDAPIEDKLLHLHRALKLSDLLYALELDAIEQEPPDPHSLRYAVDVALMSVISFFDSENLESRTLRGLAMALEDLEQGHVGPLLTRPKISKRADRRATRPPDSVSIQGLKAMAAAAMELLMRADGLSKEKAARWVARKLAKTSFNKYGNKPITYSTIRGWRDKYINAVDEADAAAANAFRMMVEEARANYPTPQKQAQFLIDGISRRARVAAAI
jgi:hypothetical protein